MVARSMKIYLLALLASGLNACQRKRHFHNGGIQRRAPSAPLPLSADESLIVNSFDNNSISDWSYYYTTKYHLAGRGLPEAQWTADRFSEAGISSRLDTYNVYLDYPISKSLVVTYPDGSTFAPDLEEDVLRLDPTTGLPNRIPTFHGYSATGEANAEYVYVGRGQQVDYQRLGKFYDFEQ